MSVVAFDGFLIDTSIWIDAHVAAFKTRERSWRELLWEIRFYQEVVLANFATRTPPDPLGYAHTKACVWALKKTKLELEAGGQHA